jgi:hypothetical protein
LSIENAKLQTYLNVFVSWSFWQFEESRTLVLPSASRLTTEFYCQTHALDARIIPKVSWVEKIIVLPVRDKIITLNYSYQQKLNNLASSTPIDVLQLGRVPPDQ